MSFLKKDTNLYNATLISVKKVTEDLSIIKIKPDMPRVSMRAGQFVNIGLMISGTKFVKRPYSVALTLLDAKNNLVDYNQLEYFEIYLAKVHSGELTPQLFCLQKGARLFLQNRLLGHYVMPKVKKMDTIVFASTGTGLAPHLPMLRDVLFQKHQGKVFMFDCVRYQKELPYCSLLKRLEAMYSNFYYKSLCTREDNPKKYIQDFFRGKKFEEEFRTRLHPSNTHVFCCGNPKMIGIPKRNREDGTYTYPVENGLCEILISEHKLTISRLKKTGNIHFEKYW